MTANREPADPREMIALEEELFALKQKYGIQEKTKWWIRAGDFLANRLAREPKLVSRKTYIRLAASCGWFCGAHRFYCGQKKLGLLYLLFFWTGIPFAMTLVDLMIALPMKPDENGFIRL